MPSDALDLFGEPIVPAAKPKQIPRGHADVPGHGPAGETCKSCDHLRRVQGSSRVYLKCWLAQTYWTHGYATDVRASDPACRLWVRREPKDHP